VLDEPQEPFRADKVLLDDKQGSLKIGTTLAAPGSHADILQALGVQMLTSGQIASIIAGMQPQQRAGFQLFQGRFRGSAVSAWQLTIKQSVNTLELQRAYSRFCAAHPNVCAIMGICIEQLDLAEPMDEDGCASPSRTAAQQPWQLQQQQQQQQPLPEVMEGGCHLWVVEEHHGSQTLAARIEQGLLSWQHALCIAQDVGSALAYLQSLKRICPLTVDGGADTTALTESNALAAPLSPLAVAQMMVLDNVQVNQAATAKISLIPAMLTQLEFALCVAADTQHVADVSSLLLPYIHPASMFSNTNLQCSGQAFDGLHSYGVLLLQLLTERSAPGLLGTVQAAIQQRSLSNLVPRTPAAGHDSDQLAEEFANLALRCCGSQQSTSSSWDSSAHPTGQQPAAQQQQQQQQLVLLDLHVLPALQQLSRKLQSLGTSAMSWEQLEELMMMPLQPSTSSSDPVARRWVRQDFKMRRKLFLEEVAKMAVEGPIHKIEVRRSRCFKDSVATFSGKVRKICL